MSAENFAIQFKLPNGDYYLANRQEPDNDWLPFPMRFEIYGAFTLEELEDDDMQSEGTRGTLEDTTPDEDDYYEYGWTTEDVSTKEQIVEKWNEWCLRQIEQIDDKDIRSILTDYQSNL